VNPDRIARTAIQLFVVFAVMYFGTHVALSMSSPGNGLLVWAITLALALLVARVVDHEQVAG
jgi:hypothetical protein